MSDRLTLCVLLWAVEGRARELAEYEDKVLALMPEHGGTVVDRLRNVEQADGPSEVQILEFSSEAALDDFMNDRRRLALTADRDRSIARTQVIRMRR